MTQLLFANNATTTLVSLAGTALAVTSSAGFPVPAAGQAFYCTIIRASDGAIEIVSVTAISGTNWTVVRAQEGTSSLTFVSGDKVELRITAAGLGQMIQKGSLPAGWLSVQTFVTNGTYTPPAGTNSALVCFQAPGGGGGGTLSSSTANAACGSGGSAGAYVEAVFPIASLSPSVPITLPSGGAGGAPGANGGTASDGTFGTLLTVKGGVGGTGVNGGAASGVVAGAAYGAGTTVDASALMASIHQGGAGGAAIWSAASNGLSGYGGASYWGCGSASVVLTAVSSGNIAPKPYNYGAGGSGSVANNASASGTGGQDGRVIVFSYP